MALLAVTHVVVDKIPSTSYGVLAYLPAVTVVVAAISALLSYASVRQSRRIWERGLLPVLVPLLDRDGLSLRVVNASKAVAADAGWAALRGLSYSEGRLAERALAPDAIVGPITVMPRAQLPHGKAPPPTCAIAWCRGGNGDLHVWTSNRTYRSLKDNKSRSTTPQDLLADVVDDSARRANYDSIGGARIGPV